MKEYLDSERGYSLVKNIGNLPISKSYIEVPEGAEELYKFKGGALEFYKDDCSKFFSISNNGWYTPVRSCIETRDIAEMIWKREKESIIDKLQDLPEFKHDLVNHPSHYTSHPSGIECIEITRHHDFAIGNAIKYLWRAGLKDSDNEIQDLEKAIFYIQDKIEQLKNK